MLEHKTHPSVVGQGSGPIYFDSAIELVSAFLCVLSNGLSCGSRQLGQNSLHSEVIVFSGSE